jgi:hypothetical protein
MRLLSEADIVSALKEAWHERIDSVLAEIAIDTKDEDGVLSQGLKIKHKDSGFLYTVSSVGLKDVVLKTPEGEEFLVNNEELEKNYALK